MGFLDNLIRKTVSNAVDKAVDSVVDNIKEKSGFFPGTANTRSSAVSSQAQDPDEEHCGYDEALIRARVEKVFAEEWSGYEVRQNVWAYEMGAEEGSHDYSYGLYLDGQPKAMVMVLEYSDDYRRKSVRLAHEACEKKGVFCMNLLPHMPNRRSYISKRLKDNVPV